MDAENPDIDTTDSSHSVLQNMDTPTAVGLEPTNQDISSNNRIQATTLEIEDSPAVRTSTRLYLILSALYLALFLSALDTTIIAQSIPTICAEFGSATGYVWVGGAYLLSNAAAGPIWARFSDIWGRKIIFLVVVVLFAASSAIAALSSNMPMLLAGRGLQGAASGGMVQSTLIIISDLFSVRKRSLYMGYTGFVWALAGSIGPLIGGAFTQFVTWRWCFWINLPLCGLTFGISLLFLNLNTPRTKLSEGLRAFDWLGTLSILAIVTLLLVGLDLGGTSFPWKSPRIICLLALSLFSVGIFIFIEQRLAKFPLIPLHIFRTKSNNAVFFLVFLHGMVLLGIEYYMPLYLQSVQQVSPIRSGVLLLPLIVIQAVVEIGTGIFIDHSGRYVEFIWAGSMFMTLGSGLYLLLGVSTPDAVIIGLEIVGALGPALLFQAPVVAIQNTVSQNDTAAATSAVLFFRNIAMALSVVIGGIIFQNSMDDRRSYLEAAGLSQPILESLSGGQAAANIGIVKMVGESQQREAILQSFAWSMKNIFILYTCLAAPTMIAIFFVKHKDLKTDHTETRTGIASLKEGENVS